jgi:hypothetical protein
MPSWTGSVPLYLSWDEHGRQRITPHGQGTHRGRAGAGAIGDDGSWLDKRQQAIAQLQCALRLAALGASIERAIALLPRPRCLKIA